MIGNQGTLDVFIGLDIGKGEHHAVEVDRGGKKLFDKALPNDEGWLREILRIEPSRRDRVYTDAVPTATAHAGRGPRLAGSPFSRPAEGAVLEPRVATRPPTPTQLSMPGRLYDLHSKWILPATTSEVWDIIADPDMSWPSWWPRCTFAKPLVREPTADTSPAGVLLATTATMNFKAILGYTLTITIHPTWVDAPQVIEFDAGGDLQGIGRVTLSPAAEPAPEDIAGDTAMDIEWRVRPTQRWMNLLTPISAPAFTAAHSHLMQQGETGLKAELSKSSR